MMIGGCHLVIAKYTTIQGDTWDFIAFKVYGTEMVMDTLMHANPHLMDIAVFNAGTIIQTPEIDTTTESNHKPPWMR